MCPSIGCIPVSTNSVSFRTKLLARKNFLVWHIEVAIHGDICSAHDIQSQFIDAVTKSLEVVVGGST